ncbi:MAG TPA: dihydroneopterin aldolase [Gemmatimonadaceae bacterium]
MPSSLADLTEIALMGMRFHVRVGVLPHERELPQPLEIDLVVRHASREPVVDYRSLYSAVSETLEADERTYLEPLAEALARRALDIEGVCWCRIVIRKPNVALAGPLAYAHVAVERSRA